MGELRMAATMDAIAAALGELGISRTYAWPVESFNPPVAIVAYPEEIRYDNTKGRGSDRLMYPVFVVVGKVADRVARDTLSGYIDPESSLSVKRAVDGTLGGAVTNAHVPAARVQTALDSNGVQYLAASFDVYITT